MPKSFPVLPGTPDPSPYHPPPGGGLCFYYNINFGFVKFFLIRFDAGSASVQRLFSCSLYCRLRSCSIKLFCCAVFILRFVVPLTIVQCGAFFLLHFVSCRLRQCGTFLLHFAPRRLHQYRAECSVLFELCLFLSLPVCAFSLAFFILRFLSCGLYCRLQSCNIKLFCCAFFLLRFFSCGLRCRLRSCNIKLFCYATFLLRPALRGRAVAFLCACRPSQLSPAG